MFKQDTEMQISFWMLTKYLIKEYDSVTVCSFNILAQRQMVKWISK